jgi:hypothetical protein
MQTKRPLDNKPMRKTSANQVEQEAFEASLRIQTNLWDEYLSFKRRLSSGALKARLAADCELPDLLVNKRSHPVIVDHFSKVFYDDRMKPDPSFAASAIATAFALRSLDSRVVFLDVDRSNPCVANPSDLPSRVRNQTEARAVAEIVDALRSLGEVDVLKLSPYKLQADRIGGSTVVTAQGRQASVSLTSFVSYRDGALGMQDGVVNTAGTRAHNLVLFVVDVKQLRANVAKASGLRRLLDRCPHVSWTFFCDRCKSKELDALRDALKPPSSSKKRRFAHK